MADLNSWNITAANNNSAPPNGWPENTMAYSDVNNTAREGMAVMARYYGDINGTLVAAGTANAVTVTLNSSAAAYFTGMYFACKISVDNTGAVTINVNGIGLQAVVNRNGSPMTAGVLQAGGIYEFRYDGTNFQLMGTVAGGSVSLTGINLRTDINTATPPVAEAVTGAFNIYDADGSDLLAQYGYIGSNVLNIYNRMHGGDVVITGESAAGAVRTLATFDPDGVTAFYNLGVKKFGTNVFGAALVSDIATASPPTTEAVTAKVAIWDLSDAQQLAQWGFIGSNTLQFANWMHGGAIHLTGQDNAGSTKSVFQGDPDTSGTLYYAGVSVMATTPTASGGLQINNTGTGAGWERVMTFSDNALKANIASPSFTGTPLAPTAALNTNTTQIATTAFVIANIADDAPTKAGSGATGTWGISITGNAATITAVDESADTTCNVLFVTQATGSLPAKTGTNLTFNSQSGLLAATSFVGNGSGLTSLGAASIATGTLAVARGGTGTTYSTGTGGTVRNTNPTFLGTVVTAAINMADNQLTGSLMDDFAILHQTVTGVASTTINYSSGQSVLLNLSANNITTLTLSNWPASGRLGQLEIELTQGATPRTVAWPAAVIWDGGTAPDLATANGTFLISLRTRNAGTSIIGNFAGPYS